MTIVNMIGGGGEDIITSQENLDLHIRSMYTANRISVSGIGETYIWDRNSQIAYNATSVGDSYKWLTGVAPTMQSSGVSTTYLANASFYNGAVSPDNNTLTPYLMSICPEGKRFTAYLTGFTSAGTDKDASPYFFGRNGGSCTATGDNTSVTYTMNTYDSSGFITTYAASLYVYFFPLSIVIQYEDK